MVTDLLISWPTNCDYPLWREIIRKERTRYNEIIIAFTAANTGDDFREFVKTAMHQDYVLFLDAPTPGPTDDWRNVAVNAALMHSYNAPWVYFTEQDFYPAKGFWDEVEYHEKQGCDVIAVYQGNRMHPCAIFSKRDALNRTRKKFGIIPDKADHFYMFQEDIEGNDLKIGTIKPATYHHFNGLSHNWRLLSEGQEPNYQPAEFKQWLAWSLQANVPLDERWVRIARNMR